MAYYPRHYRRYRYPNYLLMSFLGGILGIVLGWLIAFAIVGYDNFGIVNGTFRELLESLK